VIVRHAAPRIAREDRDTLPRVRLPWNSEFDDERGRFELRFCCEDCAHFDAASGRCRHEWPNEPHRSEHRDAEVDFCKEFELC
jgi:hypothetical protein